jgi:RNA polymerase sigma-70 factor (ECF subfamily)
VAFVLHDMFSLPFETIAPVVGRSPMAARQLASRARRRVQGAPSEPGADKARHRDVVGAFLTASQTGDFAALLAVLDPDVVLRADATAVQADAARTNNDGPPLPAEMVGRDPVATFFRGRLKAAKLAEVDGYAGLVFAPGGQTRMVVDFVLDGDRITEINMIAELERIQKMSVMAGCTGV